MLARLGWFSLFSVHLNPGSHSVMFVYILGASGGFEMIPHIGMYVLILSSSCLVECTLTRLVQDGDPDINLDIGPSTEDERTWPLVQLWLTQCLASHEACN
jgi:hypothetical protein